jgi:hypothetical protein
MRCITLILITLMLLGCATERFREIMEIRDAPLEIRILTRGIEKMDNNDRRLFEIRAKVLEPERYRNEELLIVVNDIPLSSSFLKVDTDWIIDFDQISFISIESSGFTHWNYDDLNPRKHYSNNVVDEMRIR